MRLHAHAPGYRLDAPIDCADVDRFRLGCTEAEELRERAPARAAHRYREALGLWRGPALQDVPAGPIRDREAARPRR
ncbi:BTAD domain-containing putative transcriptional regulator [Actinomadura rubrisoli]|uniref:Bacterial transcriptional activator domain-containing protein n=1 Tax=Actinomadura rubrisoli TaxID=2530368 RepID=A0A4R5B2X3_9ACTN|nr:hypothetical protein E1298_25720 [Actinomadura rubrisoli]